MRTNNAMDSDTVRRRYGGHPCAKTKQKRLFPIGKSQTRIAPVAIHNGLSVLFTAALLQACVYVPRTTTVYDEECKTNTRYMTLQPEQIGHFGSCHGRDCVYVLVAVGAVAAASAVVSGSIVVVGNAVYWAEKQGQCAFKG